MKELDPFFAECTVHIEDSATFSVDLDGDLDIQFYDAGEGLGSVVLNREQAEELHAWLSEVLEKRPC